jgi:hypothetical protein
MSGSFFSRIYASWTMRGICRVKNMMDRIQDVVIVAELVILFILLLLLVLLLLILRLRPPVLWRAKVRVSDKGTPP